MDPFDAIEEAILAVYADAELQFVGGVGGRTYALNGAVVTRISEPSPHWLIVSQGFTDLWEKETDDPEVSGWGFELTCRAPAPTTELDFGWVLHWMQHIADYLAESGAFIEAFHHMPMTEPRHDADICSVVFVEDVHLKSTRSKNGCFEFLQMVGLNPQEAEAKRRWDTCALISLMQERDPLFIADPNRPSFLDDRDFARAVSAGIEKDGSTHGAEVGVHVLWFEQGDELQIHLSRDAIDAFEHALKYRLGHGRPMLLFGDPRRRNSLVVLEPGAGRRRVETREDLTAAVIPLGDAAREELLDALNTARHEYGGPKGVVIDSAEKLRFVIADATTFTDDRYPF